MHPLKVGRCGEVAIFYENSTLGIDRSIPKQAIKGGMKMRICGAKTIAEFKEIRDEKIQRWVDDNFVKGSVTWEMEGANAFRVTDKAGDSMVVLMHSLCETRVLGGRS